jgi:hypothetical protein
MQETLNSFVAPHARAIFLNFGPASEIMEITQPHQQYGELFMIRRLCSTKLNLALIFLLLLAIGGFIQQCRHITQN